MRKTLLRRICAWVLSFSLVILTVPIWGVLPSSAAESVTLPENLTKEMAQAYEDVLMKYRESGSIWAADIVCMGAEKYPVLQVVVDTSEDYFDVSEEFYMVEDGTAKCVHTSYGLCNDGNMFNCSTSFVSPDADINYYVEKSRVRGVYRGGGGGGNANNVCIDWDVYTIESGIWKELISIEEEIHDYIYQESTSEYSQYGYEVIPNGEMDYEGFPAYQATRYVLYLNGDTPDIWQESLTEISPPSQIISEEDYNAYLKKYALDQYDSYSSVDSNQLSPCFNRVEIYKDSRYSESNFSTWKNHNVSSLIFSLQKYLFPQYTFEDVLPTLSQEETRKMVHIIFPIWGRDVFPKNLSERELFWRFGTYLDAGTAPCLPNESDPYAENVSYDLYKAWSGYSEHGWSVNSYPADIFKTALKKMFGREIEFSKYQKDHQLSAEELIPILQEENQKEDGFNVFLYVYNKNVYFFCTEDISGDAFFYEVNPMYIYDIGQNLYYMISTAVYGGGNDPDNLMGMAASLLKKVDDGEYQLVRQYPVGQILSEEALRKYLVTINPDSNFKIDYAQAAKFQTIQEFSNQLTDALEKEPILNDAGNADLSDYLEYATSNVQPTGVKSKRNIILLTGEAINNAVSQTMQNYEALDKIVQEKQITLQRTPALTARLDAESLVPEKPIQIQIADDATAEVADFAQVDALKVVLGDAQHAVLLKTDSLNRLEGTTIQIESTDSDTYKIAFLDNNGAVLNRAPEPVTIVLPADSEKAAIQAIYAGNTDNWGGQYDPNNAAISFMTQYSGEYRVLDSDVEIADIDQLSDDQQKAIQFMVSKGYVRRQDI